jgi:hypothetical protein
MKEFERAFGKNTIHPISTKKSRQVAPTIQLKKDLEGVYN